MKKIIKHMRWWLLLGLIVGALSVAVVGHVNAQTGNNYDLTWWTIDGGGGSAGGNGYTLDGSIGQPDASSTLIGGNYTLVGGFWSSAGDQYKVFLPLILKVS